MTPLIKQPGEGLTVDLPLAGLLPSGVTIATVDSVVITAKGKVAQVTALTAGATTDDGSTVQFRLTGGTDGELYLITVQATLSNGDGAERDVEVLVIDLTWFTPDPSGGYVSPEAMIARFGFDEVTQLSDLNGIGRIDAGALGAALADADGEINGYLQARYTLPLAGTPALITKLAADIARYNLHRDNAPETVTKRHEAAVRTLRAIARGEIQLGLDAAQQITAQAGGAKAQVAAARVFTPDSLADF